MANVFVSYSKSDGAKVHELEEALLTFRPPLTIWRDPLIPPVENYRREIDRQLDAAKTMLVCCSKLAMSSDNVLKIEAAMMRQIPLIPVAVESPGAFVRPTELARIHMEDLSEWNGNPDHRGFLKVVAAIGAKLGREDLKRHYDDQVAKEKTNEAARRKEEQARRIQEETARRVAEEEKAKQEKERKERVKAFEDEQRRQWRELDVVKRAAREVESVDSCRQAVSDARYKVLRAEGEPLIRTAKGARLGGGLLLVVVVLLYSLAFFVFGVRANLELFVRTPVGFVFIGGMLAGCGL